MGRRGCARTALELSKLILSLAPDEDPLGVLLCIDHFALRSRNFQFVLDLDAFYRNTPTAHPHHHVPWMANFAFSRALATWHLAARGQHPPPGEPSPDELLRSALLLHPALLERLLTKACIVRDSGLWGKALAHAVFRNADAEISDTSRHLHGIFLERNLSLWKASNVLEWLQKAVAALLEAVDAGALAPVPAERAPPLPAGLYRHIVVSNFSDNLTTIPREALQDAQQDMGIARAARPGAAPEHRNPLDPNGHPLALFLQSLFPWNDAPMDGDLLGRAQAEAAGAAGDADEEEALAWALQEAMHDNDMQ